MAPPRARAAKEGPKARVRCGGGRLKLGCSPVAVPAPGVATRHARATLRAPLGRRVRAWVVCMCVWCMCVSVRVRMSCGVWLRGLSGCA